MSHRTSSPVPASRTTRRQSGARCGNRKQRGQALVYGLFIMTGGLAALFFLFNTGQLSSEKSKLVNTADAVAYSAGVMHARTLNYLAYTNRAMLANTVAIAQLVSLSSWRQYADTAAQRGSRLGNPVKYPAYFSSYLALQERSDNSNGGGERDELEKLARQADEAISGLLRNAQTTAYQGMLTARQQVMDEVAEANYRRGADGTVVAEPLPSGPDSFRSFVKEYTGNERERFGELAQTAAKLDRFQESRSWSLDATYPDCSTARNHNHTDWIARAGGTELLGLDEWKAIDTMSEHVWKPQNQWDTQCLRPVEKIVGTGGQSAAETASVDPDPRHYDYSVLKNKFNTPLAMATSLSSSWGYSGIPEFFDLSREDIESEDPSLRFSVRLRRHVAQTSTSEGRSRIVVTPRLNNNRANAPSNELVAVSTSKVYFRRPLGSCAGGLGGSRDNCRGGHETGSLFNPYWHVGLVQDGSVATARALQGVALP
ncbi:pilus assembly protein TadG-related protein [Noviherbaspirillum aridicola]|nr:pilus assembly protein TadG-related protein [Noviherbaspirillum aridicola]